VSGRGAKWLGSTESAPVARWPSESRQRRLGTDWAQPTERARRGSPWLERTARRAGHDATERPSCCLVAVSDEAMKQRVIDQQVEIMKEQVEAMERQADATESMQRTQTAHYERELAAQLTVDKAGPWVDGELGWTADVTVQNLGPAGASHVVVLLVTGAAFDRRAFIHAPAGAMLAKRSTTVTTHCPYKEPPSLCRPLITWYDSRVDDLGQKIRQEHLSEVAIEWTPMREKTADIPQEQGSSLLREPRQ
jgi:hypothetical protein